MKKRVAIAAPLLFCVYCIAISICGLLQHPQSADAAIVLGNKVYKDGEPARRLQARLNAAIDVYKQHLAKTIVVSGGTDPSGYDQATAMGAYLREHDIPAQDIIVDSTGVNTRATAVNTKQMMGQYHWNDVVIVSQYYHLPRCMMAFREAGITHFSSATPDYFEWYDLFAIAREAIAMPVYLLGFK